MDPNTRRILEARLREVNKYIAALKDAQKAIGLDDYLYQSFPSLFLEKGHLENLLKALPAAEPVRGAVRWREKDIRARESSEYYSPTDPSTDEVAVFDAYRAFLAGQSPDFIQDHFLIAKAYFADKSAQWFKFFSTTSANVMEESMWDEVRLNITSSPHFQEFAGGFI
jgi:hypothetical protein